MKKSGSGMVLLLAALSQPAMAKEDIKVSFDEAYKIFAKIPDESNMLGLIDFCGLKEAHPEATYFLRNSLAGLITPGIPEEDRVTRASLLITTVNSYAGGVAQGLAIAQNMDPNFNKARICNEVGMLAETLFPKAGSSQP